MEPVAEFPDEAASCSGCDPVTVPELPEELAEVWEEVGPDDCGMAGRFLGGPTELAFTGSLSNEVLLDEDGPIEGDAEGPFEPEEDVPFVEGEGVPVEDAVEPFEDEAGTAEEPVCPCSVEDAGFDPDPVDGLCCVEDWPCTSVTGQTVV